MYVRLASAITIFSRFTTSRTDDVVSSVRIFFTASRFRWSCSIASNTRSPAIGRVVTRDTIGRTVFTIRRSTGKMRSMYHCITSGSDRSRSVSAVGAQSTISTS